MAIAYLFSAKEDPASPDDIGVSASGGTLAGASAKFTVAYDDAIFTGPKGKKQLVLALEHMLDKLKENTTPWPLA